MNPEQIDELAGWTIWTPTRGEKNWIESHLEPGLEQVFGGGDYFPPRLLAELLVLDAPRGSRRRSPAPVSESESWRDCLMDLHERVADIRIGSDGEGVRLGLGARLIRGLIRVLRMQDFGHADESLDLDAVLERHLAMYRGRAHRNPEKHLLDTEVEVEQFLDKHLTSSGSLLNLIGPAFTRVIPAACAPDYVDPALDVLLGEGSHSQGSIPRTTAYHEGGNLPRIVRSPTGVFFEWGGGPLPTNLKIHPIMWIYKDVSPVYFAYLAGQGQLRQPFGGEHEPSNRCAHILVDIDLFETADMHRFHPKRKQGMLVSSARAVLCTVIHNLTVRAMAHGFFVSFRLQRWQPGATQPSRAKCFVIAHDDTGPFAESPRAVRDWLALEFSELVLIRSVASTSSPRRRLDLSEIDHHARLVLGEVSAQLRFGAEPEDSVSAVTSVGMKIQPKSHEHCMFGFSPPSTLLEAELTNGLAFESISQVATLAVECCLSTTSGDLANIAESTAGNLVS